MSDVVRTGTSVRTFAADDHSIDRVFEAKRGRRITLCFPCRDEAATIGALVTSARRHLLEPGIVDDLLVLDDRSTDETAAAAADAGARVVPIDAIHRSHGVGHGKGNAMWASLLCSEGEFMVWCDGDVSSFSPEWVLRLVRPLLEHDDLHVVKAMYERPTTLGGGGRTTELVARPLLSLYAPELADLAQPLSGEMAGRRRALDSIPFAQGWGVEIAMLLDIAQRFGPGAIAQTDLGVRHHRHRSLHALSVQAAEVLATALERCGLPPVTSENSPSLTRADGSHVPLNLASRPAIDRMPVERA